MLKRLSFIFITLLLIPGFFWRILPGSNIVMWPIDHYQEKKFNLKLTGLEFNNGDLVYEFNSYRAFNGDGYSIHVSRLTDKTAHYFKKPNTAFFSNYPSSSMRPQWQVENWKKTPSNENERPFIDFADYSKAKEKLGFELTDVLNEKGNYYSYFYYLHDRGDSAIHVGNIDLYVICPKRKLFIEINCNI